MKKLKPLNNKLKSLNSYQYPDYLLLTIYISIICFSIILVYSTATQFSLKQTGDPYYLFSRHIVGIMMSFTAAIIGYLIPMQLLKKMNPIIAFVIFMLLVMPLLPGFGVEIGGAKRWLSIFGIRFQPSEIIRILVIFYLSYQLSRWQTSIVDPYWNKQKIIVVLFAGFTCLFILLQKDFSTTFLCFTTVLGLFFVAKMPLKNLFSLGIVGIFSLIPFVLLTPYRLERIDMLLNLKDNPENSYQVYQALNAFERGGFIGVGPGDGKHNIPYIFNDFIFAAGAEEFGFLGTLFILILFFVFLQRGFKIATKLYTTDIYKSLLAFGLTFSIVFQALVNIAVNMALLFPTGITLPLISYGRTSFIMTSFAVGILIQLSSESQKN